MLLYKLLSEDYATPTISARTYVAHTPIDFRLRELWGRRPAMNVEPFETLEGSEFPLCRQLSVFLENRLGQLLRLTRLLDHENVRIVGLSVETSVDYAVLRLLVDEPDLAYDMITKAGFACSESEVLVVELPHGKRGIMTACIALISGEVNINYTYPLLPADNRGACVAIQVDNLQRGAEVLTLKNLRVLDQSEL